MSMRPELAFLQRCKGQGLLAAFTRQGLVEEDSERYHLLTNCLMDLPRSVVGSVVLESTLKLDVIHFCHTGEKTM